MHVPGPGNYLNEKDEFIKKAAPKFGFGTGNRTDSTERNAKNTVGPGAYESKSFIGTEG
jgi:hypothetical protein